MAKRERTPEQIEKGKADSALRYSFADYRQKLLYPARKRAKEKGLECTISKEDIKLNKRCPLLGVEIDYSADKRSRGIGLQANAPSLDRIDSTKGYTPDNIWVISRRANVIKNDATLAELKLLTSNLAKLHNESLALR